MRFALGVVAALVLAAVPATPAAAAPHSTKHFTPAHTAGRAAAATATALLSYSGGPVGLRPRVYLVFWGGWWSNPNNLTPNPSYTSGTLETYLEDFFGGIGGSPWLGSNGEYCQGVATGATICPFGWAPIPNPAGQLAGVLTDTSAVPHQPGTPDDSPIWTVVRRAYSHFQDPHASYLVFTPPGDDPANFGSQGTGGICGWHDYNGAAGPAPYGLVPFLPDAGAGCGTNEVYPTTSDDAFGHGYFDGYSIIAGHEYVETLTNPEPSSSLAWADSAGMENGDKCLWNAVAPAKALTFGSQQFAVQSLWSNSALGCVYDSSHVRPVGAGGGYTILTGFGGIYTFGDARYWGNLIDHGYPGPAVSLTEMPDGAGYSILTTFGGIYSFGDARYAGNLIDHGYPGPAVSLAETPDGGGYALLTQSGAIYNFGDSQYFGNLLDHGYPGTPAAVAYTADGFGYYILTAEGGIYSFGDAVYRGNLIDHGYPGRAIGLALTKDGFGYSILTTVGALYSFGDAAYFGNLLDHGYPGPAVAMSSTP